MRKLLVVSVVAVAAVFVLVVVVLALRTRAQRDLDAHLDALHSPDPEVRETAFYKALQTDNVALVRRLDQRLRERFAKEEAGLAIQLLWIYAPSRFQVDRSFGLTGSIAAPKEFQTLLESLASIPRLKEHIRDTFRGGNAHESSLATGALRWYPANEVLPLYLAAYATDANKGYSISAELGRLNRLGELGAVDYDVIQESIRRHLADRPDTPPVVLQQLSELGSKEALRAMMVRCASMSPGWREMAEQTMEKLTGREGTVEEQLKWLDGNFSRLVFEPTRRAYRVSAQGE